MARSIVCSRREAGDCEVCMCVHKQNDMLRRMYIHNVHQSLNDYTFISTMQARNEAIFAHAKIHPSTSDSSTLHT